MYTRRIRYVYAHAVCAVLKQENEVKIRYIFYYLMFFFYMRLRLVYISDMVEQKFSNEIFVMDLKIVLKNSTNYTNEHKYNDIKYV